MPEREGNSLIRSGIRSVMSSWRSSNRDEVVRAAFARKSLLPPKRRSTGGCRTSSALPSFVAASPRREAPPVQAPLLGLRLMMMA